VKKQLSEWNKKKKPSKIKKRRNTMEMDITVKNFFKE
jgi:hypothetical protein